MAIAKTTPKAAADADDKDTATYLVGATPVLHDGNRYSSGDEIELTPAQANRLGLQPVVQAKE